MKVLVREAVPADKAPLMDFVRHVWGGTDYIPEVWDEWIKDQRGKMFVIEVEGRQVGMNRVRFQDDGSAWFEGVRIHPDFRGKGLASVLGENSMEFARAEGVTRFRLTSSSFNRAAHRQVAKMGFRETSRISVYEAPSGKRFRTQEGVRSATADDLRSVMKILSSGRESRLASGVYWDSYTATALTEGVVSKLIGDKSVLLCGGAAAICKRGEEGNQVWTQVGFLAGNAPGAIRIVRHVFASKGAATTGRIVYLPHGSKYVRALKKAGLKRAYSLVLFERAATNG